MLYRMSLATPPLLRVLTTTSIPSTCSKIRNVEGESTRIHKRVSITVDANEEVELGRDVESTTCAMPDEGEGGERCRDMVRRSTNS